MPPPLEPLTYEDVTNVYREEKKSASLTSLRQDFYSALRTLMEQLRREYEKEAAIDSYGAKARQLSQMISKVREKALQIFDIRADKIMHMAVLAAAGGKVEQARLTDEERRLFETALAQVQGMRNGLLDLPRPAYIPLSRSAQTSQVSEDKVQNIRTEEPKKGSQPTIPSPSPSEQVEVMLKESPPPEMDEAKPLSIENIDARKEVLEASGLSAKASMPLGRNSDEVLVRVLENIPPFTTTSGVYELSKEDIITLPSKIAKALIKRGKAQEIIIDKG
ncbi:MAG: hypothetical protein QW520_02770 [Methanomassiliicoccales archaeon]